MRIKGCLKRTRVLLLCFILLLLVGCGNSRSDEKSAQVKDETENQTIEKEKEEEFELNAVNFAQLYYDVVFGKVDLNSSRGQLFKETENDILETGYIAGTGNILNQILGSTYELDIELVLQYLSAEDRQEILDDYAKVEKEILPKTKYKVLGEEACIEHENCRVVTFEVEPLMLFTSDDESVVSNEQKGELDTSDINGIYSTIGNREKNACKKAAELISQHAHTPVYGEPMKYHVHVATDENGKYKVIDNIDFERIFLDYYYYEDIEDYWLLRNQRYSFGEPEEEEYDEQWGETGEVE